MSDVPKFLGSGAHVSLGTISRKNTAVYLIVYYTFQGANKWYELQDLHVKEILPQVITLSDSYIQVYCYKQRGYFHIRYFMELAWWKGHILAQCENIIERCIVHGVDKAIWLWNLNLEAPEWTDFAVFSLLLKKQGLYISDE